LYIIKAVRFVYHQAAGGYTLTRDEIQPEGLMICTALRAVMICQAYGLDKKIPKAFAFGIFWRHILPSRIVVSRAMQSLASETPCFLGYRGRKTDIQAVFPCSLGLNLPLCGRFKG